MSDPIINFGFIDINREIQIENNDLNLKQQNSRYNIPFNDEDISVINPKKESNTDLAISLIDNDNLVETEDMIKNHREAYSNNKLIERKNPFNTQTIKSKINPAAKFLPKPSNNNTPIERNSMPTKNKAKHDNTLENKKMYNTNTPKQYNTPGAKKVISKVDSNEKNRYLTTTMVRKITSATIKLEATKKLASSSQKIDSDKILYSDYLREKVDEIFDENYFSEFNKTIENFVDKVTNKKDSFENELLDFIQLIYNQKVEKILEINKKYEIDLSKLKDLTDLDNPSNVNNIIFQSVLADKEKDLKEIEEEFLNRKNDGILKIRNKFIYKQIPIKNFIDESEEFTNFNETLKNKIIKCLDSCALRRVNLSCTNLNCKDKDKDYNSNIIASSFNYTNTLSDVNSRKTISFKSI